MLDVSGGRTVAPGGRTAGAREQTDLIGGLTGGHAEALWQSDLRWSLGELVREGPRREELT